MRLIIVKSVKDEEEQQDERVNLPHGTKVLKGLLCHRLTQTGFFAQTHTSNQCLILKNSGSMDPA